MGVLTIRDLTRDYGGGRGVFELSLAVGEGEAFGFLGPNGAGKTTAIRHLMGFLRPQAGACAIRGRDCWRERAQIQSEVGYIPGETAFFGDMTGAEFLSFTARYRGMRGAGRADELCERFELDARGKLKRMSKGTRQKVGIVAAFQHDPAVLILDEPTSGLDPLMQGRFVALIREEKARGKTILLSSHMFEEVERTCDMVAIIKNGRLAATDTVDAMKARQVRRYTVTLETEDAARAFAREDLRIAAVSGTEVTVEVAHGMREFIAAMNRHPVRAITAQDRGLEDAFLQYYGGSGA